MLAIAAGNPVFGQPYRSSIERVSDLWNLPVPEPGMKALLFSSSPWPARPGRSNPWPKKDRDRWILAEAQGTGSIVRIWMEKPQGRIAFIFDGESKPRIDCMAEEFFSGKWGTIKPPLLATSATCSACYYPIGFAKSFRIELSRVEDIGASPYEVQCATYPAANPVHTYGAVPEGEKFRELTIVKNRFALLGKPIWDPEKGWYTTDWKTKVQPDDDAVLWRSDRPSALYWLRIDPSTRNLSVLRNIVLEFYWDKSEDPSIAVPLLDFFCVRSGWVDHSNLAIGWDQLGGYCNLVMPFKSTGRLVARNLGSAPCELSIVAYSTQDAPPPTAYSLHAEYRAGIVPRDDAFVAAKVEGPGKLVGVSQCFQGVADLWCADGRVLIALDGEANPGIVSEAMNQWFNASRRFGSGVTSGPFHSVPDADPSACRVGCNRFLIADTVPFTKGMTLALEHGYQNKVQDVAMSTVVFWYGPTQPVRRPVLADLAPSRKWVVARKDATLACDMNWSQLGNAKHRRWDEITPDLQSPDRTFVQKWPESGFAPASQPRPETVLAVPALSARQQLEGKFRVAHSDSYLVTILAVGSASSPAFEMRLDGTDPVRVETRRSGLGLVECPSLGPLDLVEGEHALKLSFPISDSWSGIHSLRLTSASACVREWRMAAVRGAKDLAAANAPNDLDSKLVAGTYDPTRNEWRKVVSKSDAVELVAPNRKDAASLGYLSFAVKSPDARSAHVMLTSGASLKVLCNGTPVWSGRPFESLDSETAAFDLPLRAGWNQVFVRAAWAGSTTLSMRVANLGTKLRIAVDPKDD